MVMSFASMLDTGRGTGVDAISSETLTTMGSVVGGWGMCLVVFAVVSTLGLSVRQRATETALLKSAGATPAQIVRMIAGEAALVSVAAAAAAVAPSYLLGRFLLGLLKDTGQVAGGVAFAFGTIALLVGFGVTVGSAVIAALWTARQATRVSVAVSVIGAATGPVRLTWKRIVPAAVLLIGGLYLGVLTVTAFADKGPDAMPVAGQACILASMGLALLAPGLVRATTALTGRLLHGRGAAGYLTVQHLRRRTGQAASALMPIILFTGIGTGILYLQLIENRAVAATGYLRSNEQQNIQTLNLVVIGMIVVFACIMLINTLVASTTFRRREFAQLRLAGATPAQVLRTVRTEGLVIVATGTVLGVLASAVTVLPYSIVRADRWIPDLPAWVLLAIIAVAVTATLSAALGTAHRMLRTPAVDAMAP
ncbi:ABC transporter permease [Actinomadura craniellae]|uniref:ABC transporter permease n=2 Tax=Actinomadura craniellae TaxID=2231787 RepID=A0A365HAM7_9ACTN|nr:ABC transporter permease [Actinomadura craniellae]